MIVFRFFCTFNRRYFEDNLTGCWQELEAQSHLNDVTICLWTKDFSESHPSYCFSRAIWQGMTMIPVAFGLPFPCLWRGWPCSLRLFEHRDRLSRSRGEQNRCLVFFGTKHGWDLVTLKAGTFVSTCHSNLVRFDGIRMVEACLGTIESLGLTNRKSFYLRWWPHFLVESWPFWCWRLIGRGNPVRWLNWKIMKTSHCGPVL